ncbi:MAG: hypothetical protein AAGC72_08140 [Planctomycetota bacterium]
MTTRSQRWLLNTLTASGIIAGVFVVRWALLPVEMNASETHTPAGQARQQDIRGASDLPPIQAFETAWSLQLQRPLYDPPPVVQDKPPPPPPTPPSVRLAGTVVEPGRSVAFLRDRSGSTRVVQVGQVVDGAELLSIEDQHVSVRFEAYDWQLTVDKEPVR